MNPLDDELRGALRRWEPPPDFAQRVLKRIASAPPKVTGWRRLANLLGLRRGPKLLWAAMVPLAACVLLVAGVLQQRHQERVRAEGEAARARVILALQIASTKLNIALREAQRVDRRQPGSRITRKSRARTEHL